MESKNGKNIEEIESTLKHRYLIKNERDLILFLSSILVLDSIVVIPVYAYHQIDALSGNWPLAIQNGLSLFMFPGIVFFIYIFSLIGNKLTFRNSNLPNIIFNIFWLIDISVGLILLLYSTITGFVNMVVPLTFYISLILLILATFTPFFIFKEWTLLPPLPRWSVIEIIIFGIFALPWLFAHIGVYISDIPMLNLVFVAEEPSSCSYGVTVHLGNHHGISGYLILIISRLILNKWLITIENNRKKSIFGLLISFIQAFGLYLFVEDFTNEQLFRFFNREILPGYESFGLNPLTFTIFGIGLLIFLFNWLIFLRRKNVISKSKTYQYRNFISSLILRR